MNSFFKQIGNGARWIGNAVNNTSRWVGSKMNVVKDVADKVAKYTPTIGTAIGTGISLMGAPEIGIPIMSASQAIGRGASNISNTVKGIGNGIEKIKRKVGRSIMNYR